MKNLFHLPPAQGLYDPEFEKDACGVGFIAHIKGVPSHQNVIDADQILQAMDHRGACGCEPNTGDGSGIMCGLPHKFLSKVAQQDLGVELPGPGRFAAGLVFLPRDEKEPREVRRAAFPDLKSLSRHRRLPLLDSLPHRLRRPSSPGPSALDGPRHVL